jgi:hypothetical protein
MFDPQWWEAGATTVLVLQNGVTMIGKNNKQPEPIRIPVPAAAAPNPSAPCGITGAQFLTASALIAAAMLALAVAILAHGLIVHHGLVASA